MKIKTKFIPKIEVKNWIQVSNIFSKSLISQAEALRQFNSLNADTRSTIKHTFALYDDLRKKKISENEGDDAWSLSVMVDAHIVATEFDIDPLTVIMCVNAPCKVNERIYII